MILNGATLNSTSFNGAVRNTLLMAFVTIGAVSSLDAAPVVTRYCQSDLNAQVVITSDPTQIFSTYSCVIGGVAVLAVVPRQQFASSFVPIAFSDVTATSFITAYPQSTCESFAIITGAGYRNCFGDTQLNGSGLISAASSVKRSAYSALLGNVDVFSVATRRCFSGGAITSTSYMSVLGGYSQSATTVIGGSATTTVYAGYGIPSATVVTASAILTARAVVKWSLTSTITLGTAVLSAEGLGGFAGNAVITGTAQMYGLPIQVQGAAELSTGIAYLDCTATYIYMSQSVLTTDSDISATAYHVLMPVVEMYGFNEIRVETIINNEHEAFSLPSADAQVSLNAQGVVIAPIISHFYGDVSIIPDATYIHHAISTTSIISCSLVSSAFIIQMPECDLSTMANIVSTAHWLWPAFSSSISGVDIESIANQQYASAIDIVVLGDILVVPTHIVKAKSNAITSAYIISEGTRIHHGNTQINCYVTLAVVNIGNPQARDPIERTMQRPFTNRIMERLFVNRVMEIQV